MALKESPPVSVSLRGQDFAGSDPDRTVVWVRGEHDMATTLILSETMSRAATLDQSDFVVDLSGVEFMDASTIGAIVGTRNLLSTRSRSVVLRAPSRSALRVLDACRLADLVESGPHGMARRTGSAAALATWVAVPATGRDDPHADPRHSEPTAPQDRASVAAAATGSAPGAAPPPIESREQR